MARVEVKEAIIENELIYSLAKTNALGDLEEIIASPNVANIEASKTEDRSAIGQTPSDVCFFRKRREAACLPLDAGACWCRPPWVLMHPLW